MCIFELATSCGPILINEYECVDPVYPLRVSTVLTTFRPYLSINYCNFAIIMLLYYYVYYPRESFREGLSNHRRWFVCLSVCLFVCLLPR